MTSLVLDHALRIRLKAETAEKKTEEATPGVSPSVSDTERSNTPNSASERSEDDAGAETETETVHSRTTTGASTATAAPSSTTTSAAPAKGKDDTKPAPAKDVVKEAERSKNLVGKINNLVTSDLDNIVNGRDFLYFSTLL